MSLVVKVAVNDDPAIAVIAIQRIEGGADPDDLNTYAYDVWRRDSPADTFAATSTGHVEHRYGDGALKLLHHVLTEANL